MFKCYSLVDFPSGTEIPFAKNVTQNEPKYLNILKPFIYSISGPSNVKINRPGTEENNGIIRHTGPQNTKYSTLEARLRSFRDWPPALKQEPRQLAEAGFYYIGFSDQTKCFYCDGGLRNWQPEDDPWTEHARWFSKCGFVRLVKGDEFISKCLDERPPEPLAPEISKNPRQASDEEIKALMSSTVVQQVLRMGVEPSRIKSALKKQILKNGQPFSDPNSLVTAALSESPSLSGAESHQSLNTQAPIVVLVRFSCDFFFWLPLNQSYFRNNPNNQKEVKVHQVPHQRPSIGHHVKSIWNLQSLPTLKHLWIWSKKIDD